MADHILTERPLLGTMSKSRAIQTARTACGAIHRRSATEYLCWVPLHNRTDGPSWELKANSYPAIREKRARRVAELALVLMGHADRIAEGELERAIWEGATTVEALVAAVLTARGVS